MASALLDAMSAYACSVGATMMQLDVSERNSEAMRLYQRHGFDVEPAAQLPKLNRLLGVNLGIRMKKDPICRTS